MIQRQPFVREFPPPLPSPNPRRHELVDTIDYVEKILAELVHDWQTVPAEIRDRLNVDCRAPLLGLLIQAHRRGWINPRNPPHPGVSKSRTSDLT